MNFNPRSRVGSDPTANRNFLYAAYFNPRSRVGSDASCSASSFFFFNFNPRSRVGSDFSKLANAVTVGISTHAPAWGATRVPRKPTQTEQYFNPRSRVGSDSFQLPKSDPLIYFNPRSRVGSDPACNASIM